MFLLNSDYKIDNLNNILTNKIATLKHREEFKDFIDLYHIAKFDKNIDWNHVISQTNQASKVIGLTTTEFKKICRDLLKLYRESDINTLTKKVVFGSTKDSQKRRVFEILDRFEGVVIDCF